MAEVKQFVLLKPLVSNVVFKSTKKQPPINSVDLCWIDEVGGRDRRKLINTHAQKRSRLLKRIRHGSDSKNALRKLEASEGLIEFSNSSDISPTTPTRTPKKERGRRATTRVLKEGNVSTEHSVTPIYTLQPFQSLPQDLSAGFNQVVTSSKSTTYQAGDLIKFAQTLAASTETISTHWGKSCTSSLGLSWSFACPLRLLYLLERVSGYVDTAQGVGPSPRTIFWRHATIKRMTALLSKQNTRYGEEVLYGIMSLLHGYLHLWGSETKNATRPEEIHSAGLRDYVSHYGGWDKLNLPSQLEQFVRMFLIMSSRRLASYLDSLRPDITRRRMFLGWQNDVQRVVSRLKTIAVRAPRNHRASLTQQSLLLPEIRQLLAEETLGICNFCHKMFILVWLGLNQWHAAMEPSLYTDIIARINAEFQSLPYRALQDVSWVIISSRVGDDRSHWETIETLKVLHRTKAMTQTLVCRWLFDLTCGTGTGSLVSMADQVCKQIWKDTVEELPNTPSEDT